MRRDDTVTIGSINNVQFSNYDKGRELRAKKSNIVKEALFIRDCVGDDWYNSGRPITRVEIRLGRDALKSLSMNSVSDLQKSERAVIDLLTTEWLRIHRGVSQERLPIYVGFFSLFTMFVGEAKHYSARWWRHS